MLSPQIPSGLVKHVAEGKCVLFLGADAAYSTEDWTGPPSRSQLAGALARAHEWVSQGQELRLAAEEYLSREPPDHHGLVSFVLEQFADHTTPGPLHQLLVDLQFDAIISNGYDDLLEIAMRGAQRRILQVVGDSQIAYAGGREEVILIRLAGTVSQPESLVLTYEDQIKVENRLSEKLQAVRGWCALRPLLFIGWDPDDNNLRRLYMAATENLGQHKRRNYIVWPTPSRRAVTTWARSNVEIIPADPLSFLHLLLRLVRQQRPLQPGYRPGRVIGKLPYKSLDYFDPEDRDIFCGREVETPLVYRMALSYPLLTLFGQSGVGKTSLLRAGVVPLLLEESYSYVYVRALGDPRQAIRDEVCHVLALEHCEGNTLHDFFQAALGGDGRLMVILDQFEEFFIRSSKWTRQQFWREVRECLDMDTPEVRFILALREDYLAELDEARRPLAEGEPAPVPTVLRDSYRLTSLTIDTAQLAIVEPAYRAHCQVESQLTEMLLGRVELPDLTEFGRWSLTEAGGTIPPPALQIVMDRLYRQTLADAGYDPPPPGKTGKDWEPPALTLTLGQYQALGGAEQILGDYVAGALDQVPAHGGDRETAEVLLKVMVTSRKTKAALDDADLIVGLAEMATSFDPDDVSDVARFRATRAILVNLRLIRSFTVGTRVLYELAHDHMAAEIATWVSQAEIEVKLARELLRREVENWRSLGRLAGPAALHTIHEHREELKRLNAEELEFLFRSALAAGRESDLRVVQYWFGRAHQANVAVDTIALERLGSDDFRTRAIAVTILGQLGQRFTEPIIAMLVDIYPQVRVAAIHALERLRPDGEWRKHLIYECYVPAGPFIMGDDQGDKDERPAHEVLLGAFYIGKYSVTNAEYKRYKDDLGQPFVIPQDKSNHPVAEVSWYDARDYAAWAGMRLLTEAEWEKAASWATGIGSLRLFERGKGTLPGRKRKYPWGNKFDERKCNTNESGIGDTTPVGKYSPEGDSCHLQ